MKRAYALVRSILVWEETETEVSLRAAAGSRREAARLALTLARMRVLPYRTYEMRDDLTFGPAVWNRPQWFRGRR